uniref:C-type lectin domain-containing protein n=2 Tax=Leptobrachium leishanense TaxID=445787 RepID=A0A8C5M6E1_9ANUR
MLPKFTLTAHRGFGLCFLRKSTSFLSMTLQSAVHLGTEHWQTICKSPYRMRNLKKKTAPHRACWWILIMVTVTGLMKFMEVAVVVVIARSRKASYNFVNKTETDFLNQTSVNSYINIVDQTLRDTMFHLCVQKSPCKLCPLNWIGFKEKCYFFSEDRENWITSRNNCSHMKADIVSLEDAKEREFISRLVSNQKGYFWIGLTKNGSDWTWQTGGILDKDVTIKEGTSPHMCTVVIGKEMSAEFCGNPNKWICEMEMSEYTLPELQFE